MEPVEILPELPSSGVIGKLVYLTSDRSLYRFNGHVYIKAQARADLSEAEIKVDPEPAIPPALSYPEFYEASAQF